MNEIMFLTYEQVFGNNQLDILKKYGTKCAITDFSILLGGEVSNKDYTSEGNTGKDRACAWWWTKSADGYGYAHLVDAGGNDNFSRVNFRIGGARPVLPYSSISSICSNEVRDINGIKEVEYGEYPQTIVDENYSAELERAFNNGNLSTTGKNYTTDSVAWLDTDKNFKAIAHAEYEYNGSKYIRLVANSAWKNLSDGRTIKLGNAYWVRVEPITWLVDEKANIALSKKVIFSGVQFNNFSNGFDHIGDFARSDIKQFMDNYFSKEIVSDRVYSQATSVEKTQNVEGEESERKTKSLRF